MAHIMAAKTVCSNLATMWAYLTCSLSWPSTKIHHWQVEVAFCDGGATGGSLMYRSGEVATQHGPTCDCNLLYLDNNITCFDNTHRRLCIARKECVAPRANTLTFRSHRAATKELIYLRDQSYHMLQQDRKISKGKQMDTTTYQGSIFIKLIMYLLLTWLIT